MDVELLTKTLEELKIAQEAIHKHEDRQNIVHLRKAYESVNNARRNLGEALKQFKSC